MTIKKNLTSPELSSNELFGLMYKTVNWEVLKTAMELKVFDQTKEPVTADAVAAALQTHPANTDYMLNALVALGLLGKNEGVFRNTPLADQYLVSGSDTYLCDSMMYMSGWDAPLLNGGMKKLVQEGPPPPQPMGGEELWATAARTSLNYTRSGRAQNLATQVASLPEFASFEKALDLGAGAGIIGIAIAQRHPSLKLHLFDQPAVCNVAREVIAEYGMEDRVSTIGGDYMNDPLEGGYDLITAIYTLNFFRDRLDELFDKIYAALNPGGVFLVGSDSMRDEKTAPAESVLSWLSTVLQGIDMSFEQGQIEDAMLRAGFVSTQSCLTYNIDNSAHGPMNLIVARKSRDA